ncbi:MAG: S8 family serine peptidase [Acidobacteriota bacterium]
MPRYSNRPTAPRHRRWLAAVGMLLACQLVTHAEIPGNLVDDPPPPAPQPCKEAAFNYSILNTSPSLVDGLNLHLDQVQDAFDVLVDHGNPFGMPVAQGATVDGGYRLTFDGADVQPGEVVRVAACVDSSSLGWVGAEPILWLLGGQPAPGAPAPPTVGHRILSQHLGAGQYAMTLELFQERLLTLAIEDLEVALGPVAPLADLHHGAGTDLSWTPVVALAELSAPAPGGPPSVLSLPLPTHVSFADPRALFVRFVATDTSGSKESIEVVLQFGLDALLRPRHFDLRAIEEANLQSRVGGAEILQRGRMDLPETGTTVWRYKLVDTAGDRFDVGLDPQGNAVAAEALWNTERGLHLASHGKMSAELAELLPEADPTALIDVGIWLEVDPSLEARAPKRPTASKPLSIETLNDLAEAFTAHLRQRAAEAAEPVLAGLTGLDPEASAAAGAPVLFAQLRPSQIQQVASWPGVAALYPVRETRPEMATALTTTGARIVHLAGTLGGGERVGMVEVGADHIPEIHPFLPLALQPREALCTSPHATGVAGILAGPHSTEAGIAPGASLVVSGSCSGSVAELEDAVLWQLEQGVRAVNLSWGTREGDAPGILDRTFDDLAFTGGATFVTSAGNEGWPCAYDGGGVTSPGRGYGVIAVGSLDDRVPGAPTLGLCSSYADPASAHGDRRKPDLVAPAMDLVTTVDGAPWIGTPGSGSSYASPMVAGGVALLFERDPRLRFHPEAVKALLLATASLNVEGRAGFSDRDGAGAVQLHQAADAAGNGNGRSWDTVPYDCAGRPEAEVDTITLAAGRRTRIAVAWGQPATFDDYHHRPAADLDLEIWTNGARVAASSSFDDTFEIVDFEAPTSGTYRVRVVRNRCDQSPGHLAWAWWQSP